MVKNLAPIDPHLALKYLPYVEDETYQFLLKLTIAESLPDREAAALIQTLKTPLPLQEPFKLYWIYLLEEERQFPQAEDTLSTTLAADFKTVEGLAVQAYFLGMNGKREEAQEKLEKAFALFSLPPSPLRKALEDEDSRYWSSAEDLYGMLFVAAEFQLPLVDTLLEAFYQHAFQTKFSYQKLAVLEDVFEILTLKPELHVKLEENLERVITYLQSLSLSDPEDREYTIYSICQLLIPVRPDLAKKLLPLISDGYDQTSCRIALFAHTQEGDLETLSKLVQKHGDYSLHLEFARAVYEQLGIEQALPLIDGAKKYIEDPWDLALLLELELECNLPRAQETLAALYQEIEEDPSYLEEALEAIIHAELNFSFARGKGV